MLFLSSKNEKTASNCSKNNRKPFNYCSINVLAIESHLFFVAFDRINSPLIMHAFLFSTTPPLLNSTRSSEHCFVPISSAVRTLYIGGMELIKSAIKKGQTTCPKPSAIVLCKPSVSECKPIFKLLRLNCPSM